MKKNGWFILGVLAVAYALFFYPGLKQQAVASTESVVSKSEPVKPEPSASTAEPVQPKEVVPPAKSVVGPNDFDPSLKVESSLYDFGEIAVRSVNDCKFKFINTGKGKLIIRNIKPTCGCTVPALDKKEYATGESGTIDVHFTAPAAEGDVVKHLYIQSNDKQNPDAELIIKAKVIAKVKYEPDLIKLAFNQANAGCPPIKLRSTDGRVFSVKSFKSTAECLTADFDPNVSAAELILKPKVNVETLRKVTNGTVNISLTHPQCNEITILFEATPAFSLNPPMIMILKAQPQTSVTREVWVLNNYKEPFEIESVSSQKGIAKLLSQEKQENGCKLIFQITPPASQGKIKIFSDTISIAIKGGERLEVNCRGFYEKDSTKGK